MDNQFYENLGLKLDRAPHRVYTDAPLNTLVEQTILSGEGKLSKEGALTVTTGKHTGRSANDKYIVRSKSLLRDFLFVVLQFGKRTSALCRTAQQTK